MNLKTKQNPAITMNIVNHRLLLWGSTLLLLATLDCYAIVFLTKLLTLLNYCSPKTGCIYYGTYEGWGKRANVYA